MYKYQNISEVTQTITATGDITPRIVEPNEFTTSSIAIENPNFKYVGQADDGAVQAVVTETQANSVTEAEMLDDNETNKEIN